MNFVRERGLLLDKVEVYTRNTCQEQVFLEKNMDYTYTPVNETNGMLKVNIGKSKNKGLINLGEKPKVVKSEIENILNEKKLAIDNLKSIEYCINIETDFKLVDNKNILETFNKALAIQKYKSGKVDYIIDEDKNIKNSKWKGIKGYKTARSIKLYSKYEENKNIEATDIVGDLLRLELIFSKRVIEQNKIKDISDVEKAKNEMKDFLKIWKGILPEKINRYTKITKEVIKKLTDELEII